MAITLLGTPRSSAGATPCCSASSTASPKSAAPAAPTTPCATPAASSAGPSTGATPRSIEAAKERKQRRLPSPESYQAVLTFARQHAAPYLWMVMELAYLLRLRSIEVLTLTDANETADGVLVNRRKGSRGNLTLWGPRLSTAWQAAKALRQQTRLEVLERLPPERQWLFPASDGQHLRSSSLSTAWQRMIKMAIEQEVITEEQRFSLHDLKRAGVSRTEGTRAEKQEASGHRSGAMMDVYDLSRPVVRPTEE